MGSLRGPKGGFLGSRCARCRLNEYTVWLPPRGPDIPRPERGSPFCASAAMVAKFSLLSYEGSRVTLHFSMHAFMAHVTGTGVWTNSRRRDQVESQNRLSFLKPCLRSCVHQSFEIGLVNGGRRQAAEESHQSVAQSELIRIDPCGRRFCSELSRILHI